jgi:hypothetical protein
MDHGADLKEVQVFDSARSRLIATLQTENAERLNASDRTILTLAEPEQRMLGQEKRCFAEKNLLSWTSARFSRPGNYLYR